MKSYFNIFQASTSNDNRPPISHKVREYFIQFLSDNLLKRKKIIIGGKWEIILSILFTGEGKYGPKGIFMPKNPRTISSESVKLYEIIIPSKLIQESDKPFLKTIELMYEAIKVFFTTTYKKITPEFMDELWKKVDLDYLLSLPYPAPLSQQKYVGDIEQPDGTAVVQMP